MKIVIFTDGAITRNGDPDAIGGWGAVILAVDEERNVLKEKEIYGYKFNATSNQMELLAIYKALEQLDPNLAGSYDFHVISDSQYCVLTFQERVYKWEREGWSKKKPNVGLIKAIYEKSQLYDVEWHWVKGHNGNKYNERADELAVAGKEEGIKEWESAKA